MDHENRSAESANEVDRDGRPTRRQMLLGGALVAGVAAYGGAERDAAAATRPAPTTPRERPVRSSKPTTITVNAKAEEITSPGATMLLYVLRDELGLRGPKFGCGLAQCGACSVLANGKEIRSCVTPLNAVGKRKITTLEGLAASYHGPGKPAGSTLHPLQRAWIDEQVPQCGYCQNGMMIQAADLLSATPRPTDAQIKQAMDGHLCRCGTHFRILKAVKRASATMHGA
jgi:aerobic-type carbon monoxide dehydrogenase small subunit (CoxS/CutS family)